MYRQILIISTLIFGIAGTAPPVAQAQIACGARDTVVASLGEKYGEVRRGGGLTGSTALYEIWTSETTGSWTILKTTPNGVACVMAVGENWLNDAPDLTVAGNPA